MFWKRKKGEHTAAPKEGQLLRKNDKEHTNNEVTPIASLGSKPSMLQTWKYTSQAKEIKAFRKLSDEVADTYESLKRGSEARQAFLSSVNRLERMDEILENETTMQRMEEEAQLQQTWLDAQKISDETEDYLRERDLKVRQHEDRIDDYIKSREQQEKAEKKERKRQKKEAKKEQTSVPEPPNTTTDFAEDAEFANVAVKMMRINAMQKQLQAAADALLKEHEQNGTLTPAVKREIEENLKEQLEAFEQSLGEQ